MRPPTTCVLALPIALVVLASCAELPTQPVSPPGWRAFVDDSPQRLPRRAVIAEAKEALGAVLTGEQTYLQKWATFTDVPDTADYRVVLGVDLRDSVRRWAFSVSGASLTGFVATARGRAHSRAQGIVETLRYERNQPLVWTVQWRRAFSLAAAESIHGAGL